PSTLFSYTSPVFVSRYKSPISPRSAFGAPDPVWIEEPCLPSSPLMFPTFVQVFGSRLYTSPVKRSRYESPLLPSSSLGGPSPVYQLPNGSTTFTVRSTVVSFPTLSLTVYVTVYVPILLVSTSPEISILSVKSPSTLSLAVAPGSSYGSPCSTIIGLSPFNVMIGDSLSIATVPRINFSFSGGWQFIDIDIGAGKPKSIT